MILSDDNKEILLQYETLKGEDVKPNVPYFVRAKKTGRMMLTLYNINLYVGNEKPTEWTADGCNYFVTGTYKVIAGQDMYNNGYKVVMNNNIGCSDDVNARLNAFRWYMSVTDAEGNVVKDGRKVRLVEKGSEDTGIDTLYVETMKDKVYDINGMLIPDKYMERNNKGIYIVNGRKVVKY